MKIVKPTDGVPFTPTENYAFVLLCVRKSQVSTSISFKEKMRTFHCRIFDVPPADELETIPMDAVPTKKSMVSDQQRLKILQKV